MKNTFAKGSVIASYLKLLHRYRGEPVGAYDEVSATYDDFARIWDHQVAAPALSHVNHLIEERIKPGAVVLDAGAGTGERTLALLAHSQPAEVIALDASERKLSVARSKIDDPRVCFVQGDVRALPFADHTFDVVVCTWVIEIMDDPRAVVQEFIRVIKPGGIVIYAFCSLPEGTLGNILKYVIAKSSSKKESPLTHLLSKEEWPFHRCDYASLKQFAGGLTTVVTVGKCCTFTDEFVTCRLRDPSEALIAGRNT
jgi:ubiquinone/menaquinone biosynthesis C-methylase UbiE